MIFGSKKSREPTVGDDVLTRDEEHFGDVAAVHADHLEVTSSTADRVVSWRVPRTAISKIDDQGVHLSVTRAVALAKGWEHTATV